MDRLVKSKCFLCVFVVCIFLCGLYGCFHTNETSETDEQVYASVNGINLTEYELKSLIPMDFYDKITPEHKKEIVKEWVDNELLYQEALHVGIDKEPDIARILKNSKRDLLRNELLERRLEDIEIPSEQELREYYEVQKEYFILLHDEYRIRYALFDNMKDAESFWDRVKKGASFSDLAQTESKHPSSKSGGEIGLVNEETVETTVWETIINTVETLGLKKISNPFSVIDGFGIVIVDEILKRGTVKPFEDTREQILDLYMIEKREEAKESLLKRLRVEAKIEYNF